MLVLSINTVSAAESQTQNTAFSERISAFFSPKTDTQFNTVQLQQLSKYQQDQPLISLDTQADARTGAMGFSDAIRYALLRNPTVSQKISIVAAQNSNIDAAKSQYYPQISGGVGTGDLSSSQRGSQLLSLTATQMLYDFGKVKSSVNTQKAKLQLEQANVLISIDDIAYQVSYAMVSIERYRKNVQIAQQQISGIARILEIAQLRARAGISSQADPIQAQSFLQSAQSNLIAQQSLLQQYQQRLNILLGFDANQKQWDIPPQLIQASNLYDSPDYNLIPRMIAAQIGVEVAKSEKKQIDLTRYPTLALKGSVSQAINGVNPGNNKDNGFDQAIMLEASSNFYQGGATSARTRAASYAEEAARGNLNAVYLEVQDEVRTIRETIENKQLQMQVLRARQATTVQTRELYQEQYKLGTRTVLDLLNAEMGIHTAVSELENARYDIYASLAQYISSTGKTRQAYDLNNISIQGFEVQP